MANKVFTDAEINEILKLIKDTTGHLQYIGARYVPLFGRKGEQSIEWDNAAPYEPLTIVLHEGNSYTSRQFVPTGIDILNQDFWANTGNYNAQIEQYRQEVLAFDGRISANETSIADVEQEYNKIFNTVADMKADTTLKAGMTVKTNGFHSIGDGGAAFYTISNAGTANEMDVIACQNGLFASLLVNGYVTPEMFGAYGDGVNDDTAYVNYIVAKNYNLKGFNVYLLNNAEIGFNIIPEDNMLKYSSVYLKHVISHGTNAICLQGVVNFSFDLIENDQGNGITFIKPTYDSTIKGERINAKKNGIHFNTQDHECWVQYCEFNIKQIKAGNNALNVQRYSKWFNSNRFINCVFAGGVQGIYLASETGESVDENVFIGVSVEGSFNGIYCKQVSRTQLVTVRTQEVTEGFRLKLVGSNKYNDFFINTAALNQIDLSEVTGGSNTVIRGTFFNSLTEPVFSKIYINNVNNAQLLKMYSNITYERVDQLKEYISWASDNFNYCEGGTELRNNPENVSQIGAQKIFVDSNGGATINFNSEILKYLGTIDVVGDLTTDTWKAPVTMSIDNEVVRTLTKPCSIRFVNDYRKLLTW